MRGIIHRAGMSGGARCKAQGEVKISCTGVMVTCPDCLALERQLTPQEAMAEFARIVAEARSAGDWTHSDEPPKYLSSYRR